MSAQLSNMPEVTLPTPIMETVVTQELDTNSLQERICKSVGRFVVCKFLIGTGEIVRKQGMLYLVGRSFVTLYDEPVNNFIVCDIFSVKFVYFFMPNERPRFNYNILPHPNQNGRRSM